MSELKKTGLIFLIAAALYAYLAAYEDDALDDLDGPQRLVRAAAVEIDEVHVELTPEEGDARRFTLRRVTETELSAPADGWRLEVDGEVHDADPTALQHLLQRVGTFDVLRVADDGSGDLTSYGLEAPQGRVTWRAPEAEDPEDRAGTLVFGGRSPVGPLRFVKRQGDPRVYAADSWKVALLSKVPEHYRDKRLLPTLNMADVAGLEVRLSQEDAPRSLSITEDGQWRASSPADFPLDRMAMRDLIGDLDALRAREFLGPDTPEVRAEYGLVEPAMAATLTTTDGAAFTIELGERDPERTHRVRVASSRLEAVVTVDADLLRRLGEPMEELREKFFLRGRLDDVQRLVVTVDGRTEEFARVGGPWKSMTDPTDDHGEIVGAALDALGTLRARTWRDQPGDLAAYGLANPSVEVKAYSDGGELHLMASEKGEETGPWVRLGDGATVYRTQGKAFLEKLRLLVAVVAAGGSGADAAP